VPQAEDTQSASSKREKKILFKAFARKWNWRIPFITFYAAKTAALTGLLYRMIQSSSIVLKDIFRAISRAENLDTGWNRTCATNSEERYITQGGSFFVTQPMFSDASFRSYAPLFEAYRAGACTQPVHFESVYVYVYKVEPSDDSSFSPPALRLCR
jgi:hypothetical protein